MMPTMNPECKVLPDAPAVLDVEASGFGRDSYPIEVGFVLPSGQMVCALIRPEPQWTHWDPLAERVHNISRDTLLYLGQPAQKVARMLNEQLRGMTVYSDGWVNDYSWLGRLFDAAELSPSFRLENLRALLRDDEADQWHDVKRQVASERGAPRHRASTDARLLQLTLQRLRALSTMP
jgi:hypothetical protein